MPSKALDRLKPHASPRPFPGPYYDGDGRPVLTTGHIAALCGVAPRTASKWCDLKLLKSWRLPGTGADRRVYAADLRQLLADRGVPVPAQLDAVCGAGRELILYRCPAAVAARVEGMTVGAVAARRVESEWELGGLFTRPFVTGVLVCGSDATVAEAARVFARVGEGWVKVHAHGPDQQPAAGADFAFPEDAGEVPAGCFPRLAATA